MSRMSRLNSTIFRNDAEVVYSDSTATSHNISSFSDGVIISRDSDTMKYDNNMNVLFTIAGIYSRSKYVQDNLGNIYFGNANGLYKASSNGIIITHISEYTNIRGIAIDASGNITIARSSTAGIKSLIYLNPSLVEQWSKLHEDYSGVSDVAMDSEGNVIFVRYATSGYTIVKLDSSGNFIWGKSSSYITTVCIDRDDNVIICGGVAYSKVMKWDKNGDNYKYSENNVGMNYATYNKINVDNNGFVFACSYSTSAGYTLFRYDPLIKLTYSLYAGGTHAQCFCPDNRGFFYGGFNSSFLRKWEEY